MGPHLMRRPPKYVHGYIDRHGRARFYFRRAGFKKIALPGLPWSPDFMAAYELALAGQERIEIGASRTRPGTVAALTVAYFNSIAFRCLAAETQRTRRNILERFRAEHGDKRFTLLQREHIVRMLGSKISKPSAARNWLNTIRAMMQFAIAEGMRQDDPTRDVKSPKIKTEGFTTWSEENIAAFEQTHAIGTRARLALALLLYTAQRRSDVVRMGRQNIRDGALHVRQQKTGATLVIPLHSELRNTLDATPPKNMTFLTTREGKPFTAPGFTNWFRDCCNDAHLPHGISAHGLRKAACRRLAEAGCTAHEIMSISGHASLREVQRYTAACDQVRLARAAMEKSKTRTSSG
jgi:integrase